MGAEHVRQSNRLEHPPRRRRNRRRTPIETVGQRFLGIGGIDNHRADTMRIKRQRKRQANQPAAKDKDFCALHGVGVAASTSEQNAIEMRLNLASLC